jgi:hypothetical protein
MKTNSTKFSMADKTRRAAQREGILDKLYPRPKPIDNCIMKPDDIPYKNRRGQWVFRSPLIAVDMNWPGFKHSKGWKPVLINGKWEWEAE